MYDAEGNLDKDHLVEAYAPLVKRIAYHLMAKLPASVEVEDLIQNGLMGLLDAIGRYEDGLGAQFETYAVQRIRGAMLDGLRENDWLPRSLRRDMRRIESAIHTLEQQHGRQPTETELAAALDLPLADYQRLLQDARGYQLVYFEDFTDGEGEDYFERHLGVHETNPADLLEDADMRGGLVRAIDGLPEREKLVMALYYDEELNLREIGEVLGVTESRVCQLHSQAIARLRASVFGQGAPAPTGARRGRPPKKQPAGT
ncbi:RNA polymerase sigma factor FliA [Pseudothauera rhizosphaerae]|uniref:RNA polymerase sigma factor FliA n=1 Tax=Pseudothauera rhizosphaerae TaxID=2565932 RepID=A0A4S4AWD8_9RHOO|nr:RNA polymerase sigma factor FliA [Pseudothauera rhizosphaerae]THF64197.1 RNA polymerase sigma factor FliA [Pseudothauera rhizosphaerae]